MVLALARPAFSAGIHEVIEFRTAHSRYWGPVDVALDGTGEQPAEHGSAYTEIACGLHWNGAGPGETPFWVPTKLEWEAQADGSAIIVEAPRSVWLAPSLLQHPFMISEPADGGLPPLRFSFHGLAYMNPQTGEFAWVAYAKNATLQLEGALAFYRDALDSVDASWVVEHRGDGLSAGLVLHELPPPPSMYGFADEGSVELVVFSEIVDPAGAIEIGRKELGLMTRDSVHDVNEVPAAHQQIAWYWEGGQKAHILGRGRAYRTDSGLAIGKDISGGGAETEVHSGMIRVETGELVYYEGIAYSKLEGALGETLPVAQLAEDSNPRIEDLRSVALASHDVDTGANLQALREERMQLVRSSRELMVYADPKASFMSALPGGVFIDYETIDSAITTPTTLEAGRTYYVSSGITVSSELTVEGGAVVKMGGGGRFTLAPGGSIKTETTPFQPATVVSKNCDTIGAVIAGSTGTPARGDCQRGFELDYQQSGTLEHLRIAHAWLGIRIYSGDWAIRHCVLRDNYTGLEVRENSTASVGNVLFKNNQYWAIRMWLSSTEVPQVSLTNVTVDGSLNYVARYDLIGTGPATTGLSVVNSAFKAGYGKFYDDRSLTNITLADTYENCAFGHATEPPTSMRTECQTLSDWTEVYTSTAIGDYYLSSMVGTVSNPLINAGVDQGAVTTELLLGRSAIVPPQLPATLLKTHNPLSGWVGLAPRDGDQGVNDTPDLGYHYPAVDGLVGNSGMMVEGEFLAGPGRVLALEGTIVVDADGRAELWGSPEAPVTFVPWWQVTDQLQGYRPGVTADQYTALSIQEGAATGNRLEHLDISGFYRCLVIDPLKVAEVAHCEFRPFEIGVYPYNQSGSGALAVRNCLFVGQGDGTSYGIHTYGNDVSVGSSTFYNLDEPMTSSGGGTLSALNCLFARYPAMSVSGSFDYCGFWDCAAIPILCLPANATNPRECSVNPFTEGPLGKFYLNSQTDGGDLLRGNAQDSSKGGSGPATAAGLYAWTVDPLETLAGTGEISIGYHYPSRLDTDGDGAWDATEDTNGNGQADLGDDRSDFADADDVPPWMVDLDENGLWDEDEDRDGLPDAWEISVGLNTFPIGDPYDRDGMFGNPDGDANCNQFELMQAALPHKSGAGGAELEKLITNKLPEYHLQLGTDSTDCGGDLTNQNNSVMDHWHLPDSTESSNGYIFEIKLEAEVEEYEAYMDCAFFKGAQVELHVASVDHPLKGPQEDWRSNPPPSGLVNPCGMTTEVSNPIWKHWLSNGWDMELWYETMDFQHHQNAEVRISSVQYFHVEFEDADQLYGWDDFTCTWHPDLNHKIKGIHVGQNSDIKANFVPQNIQVNPLPPSVLSSAVYTNQVIRMEASQTPGNAEVRVRPDNAAFDGIGYWPPNSFGVIVLPRVSRDLFLVRVHRPNVTNIRTMSASKLQQLLDETYLKQGNVNVNVNANGDNPWGLFNCNYDTTPTIPDGKFDPNTELMTIKISFQNSGIPGAAKADNALFLLDLPNISTNALGQAYWTQKCAVLHPGSGPGIARHEIGHLLGSGLEDLDGKNSGTPKNTKHAKDYINVMSYWSNTPSGTSKNIIRADQWLTINGGAGAAWWDVNLVEYGYGN